jgi:hypothetical protein
MGLLLAQVETVAHLLERDLMGTIPYSAPLHLLVAAAVAATTLILSVLAKTEVRVEERAHTVA